MSQPQSRKKYVFVTKRPPPSPPIPLHPAAVPGSALTHCCLSNKICSSVTQLPVQAVANDGANDDPNEDDANEGVNQQALYDSAMAKFTSGHGDLLTDEEMYALQNYN